MDDDRGAFVPAQLPWVLRVVGYRRQAQQRIGPAAAITCRDRLDRRTYQRSSLGVESRGQLPAAVGRPRLCQVLTWVAVLLVVVHRAQTADHHLQLGHGGVPRRLDQVLDQPILTWAGEAADRADLRKRQPA